MQEKQLFEYAVIRIVPCVEREEFLNVGVILYCAAQNFLQTKYSLNKERLLAFAPEINIAQVEERLYAFVQITNAAKDGRPIATLPIASRFRWLTATKSTMLQTSPVHPGLCTNAAETLLKLFDQLVIKQPK
jgi:hypothetical protein